MAVKLGIDYTLNRAVVNGRSKKLTRIRWRIYRSLFEAGGSWVDRKALYEAGWQEEDFLSTDVLLVRWHICQLRKTLGRRYRTIFGEQSFGYRLNVPPS